MTHLKWSGTWPSDAKAAFTQALHLLHDSPGGFAKLRGLLQFWAAIGGAPAHGFGALQEKLSVLRRDYEGPCIYAGFHASTCSSALKVPKPCFGDGVDADARKLAAAFAEVGKIKGFQVG